VSHGPIIVLGSRGMLGSDLLEEFGRRGVICHGLDVDDCDITDSLRCGEVLGSLRPSVVMNCAAYTDVNRAEAERDRAFLVNAAGAANVARSCSSLGARCVYISTDYVFDGSKEEPYTESDVPGPINTYGKSKLEGERATAALAPDHAIVRTSWLYGKRGRSFVTAMLDTPPGTVRQVVCDQVGAPTYTRDLAVALAEIAERQETGIFHRTNADSCSWFEFATAILNGAGRTDVRLVPIASHEYSTPARRPANSRLRDTRLGALGIAALPTWPDALHRFLKEVGQE
jgi:dTDP-4-dehydrorhamnose reductase